jgi:hypothetical protein
MGWRVGSHYGIHVYEGERPVATFHRAEDAAAAVHAFNLRKSSDSDNSDVSDLRKNTGDDTLGGPSTQTT